MILTQMPAQSTSEFYIIITSINPSIVISQLIISTVKFSNEII